MKRIEGRLELDGERVLLAAERGSSSGCLDGRGHHAIKSSLRIRMPDHEHVWIGKWCLPEQDVGHSQGVFVPKDDGNDVGSSR